MLVGGLFPELPINFCRVFFFVFLTNTWSSCWDQVNYLLMLINWNSRQVGIRRRNINKKQDSAPSTVDPITLSAENSKLGKYSKQLASFFRKSKCKNLKCNAKHRLLWASVTERCKPQPGFAATCELIWGTLKDIWRKGSDYLKSPLTWMKGDIAETSF